MACQPRAGHGHARRLFCILFALAFAGSVHAQQPPPATPAAPAEAKVQVARIQVDGVGEHPDSGITEAGMQALANEALRDFDNASPATLDFRQIEQIAAKITQAYRQAGFLVSQAYVPPQRIGSDHVLHVQVVEGRVGRILVQGSRRYRDDQLSASSLGLIGRPLRESELERAVLYARDLPGVTVTSVLKPGQDSGETDIVLVAQDSAHPYEFNAGASNYGTPSTGRYRADIGINAFNALGMGDVLGASVSHGIDPANSWQAALSLSVPVKEVNGLGVAVGASRSELELDTGPFGALDIKGPTTLFYAGSDWKFIQRTDLQAQASLRWIHEQSRLDGLGIQLSRHVFDVVDAGFSLRQTDFQGRGINMVQASVRKAVRDGSLPDDWLYPAHAPDFLIYRLSLARLQGLPGNQRLLLRANGQFTGDSLTPLEQFGLGGPTGVRAYPLFSALGDRGVQGTLEYQVGAPGFADRPSPFNGRRWGDLLQVSLFYDWGRTTPAPDNRRIGIAPVTLAGAGAALNLRLPWKPELQVDLTVAAPTGGKRAPYDDGTQVWARIGTTF